MCTNSQIQADLTEGEDTYFHCKVGKCICVMSQNSLNNLEIILINRSTHILILVIADIIPKSSSEDIAAVHHTIESTFVFGVLTLNSLFDEMNIYSPCSVGPSFYLVKFSWH